MATGGRRGVTRVRAGLPGHPRDGGAAAARAARRGSRDRAGRLRRRTSVAGDAARRRRARSRPRRSSSAWRSPTIPTTCVGARRRPRRRRRLRPPDPAAPAGGAADGQPALLAAAALAGRGAGRAGDPRGRRRSPASASWRSRRGSTPAASTTGSRCPIGEVTTAAALRRRAGRRRHPDAGRCAATTASGTCVPQSDEGVTYAAKLTADDLRLDWDAPGDVDRSGRPGRWCLDDVPRRALQGARRRSVVPDGLDRTSDARPRAGHGGARSTRGRGRVHRRRRRPAAAGPAGGQGARWTPRTGRTAHARWASASVPTTGADQSGCVR